MRSTTVPVRTALGLLAALALLVSLAPIELSATDGSAVTSSDGGGACEVSLEPQTVHVGEAPVGVAATPSQPIGTLVTAAIDDQAEVVVEIVLDERGPEGYYALALDLEAANVGDWEVTLSGAHGDCTGTVRVESFAISR